MTLEEIQELRLKEGAGGEDAALTERRVPTLEQALLAAGQRSFWARPISCPIIRECREDSDETCSESLSQVVPQYAPYDPVAYEIVFQSESYLSGGVESIVEEKARVWVNTLAADHAAGHVDDQNLADPAAHWGHLIDMKVDMIQTDRPELLMDYLTSRGYRDRGARSPR